MPGQERRKLCILKSKTLSFLNDTGGNKKVEGCRLSKGKLQLRKAGAQKYIKRGTFECHYRCSESHASSMPLSSVFPASNNGPANALRPLCWDFVLFVAHCFKPWKMAEQRTTGKFLSQRTTHDGAFPQPWRSDKEKAGSENCFKCQLYPLSGCGWHEC